jgi:hypothetical protein
MPRTRYGHKAVQPGLTPICAPLAIVMHQPLTINLISELVADGRRLDEPIATVSTAIEALAKQDIAFWFVAGFE